MNREALRGALRSAGPSHYALVDMNLATRLGGAMWLIACAYTLVLLPLAPPQHGAVGWSAALAGIALAAVGGLNLVRRPQPARPFELLAGNYVAIGAAALLGYLVGSGSPAPQLLLLAILYAGAIHPARHVLNISAAATVAHFLPLTWRAVDGGFVPRTAAQVLLGWSLAAVLIVWSMGVRRQREESAEAREAADALARVDPLTGLGNKRALDEALQREVGAAADGRPLAVLVCDLDEFKSINDVYGHPAGDAVLRDVAVALGPALRDGDPCFRWGGDEFVALLPGGDLATAHQVALRLVEGVAATCTRPDGRPVLISVGVSDLVPGDEPDDLLGRADADLLRVKAAGGRSLRLVEGASA